jgi:hypothetical protein
VNLRFRYLAFLDQDGFEEGRYGFGEWRRVESHSLRHSANLLRDAATER